MLKQLLRTLSAAPEDFLTFCRIMQLFFDAATNDSKPISRKSNRFSDIVEYVANHYLEIESLDDLAARFYITKHHLCRLFKQATGVTVVNYVNARKIRLACEKLKFTKAGIEKIALECGFHSSMYFCKLFKETFGLTPSEYRKQEQI
jgi:AraC-like DNA-binding protein